jgi:excinuclease ABC subunit C
MIRDGSGKVIFVGKGVNLRKRLDALINTDAPRALRPHQRYQELRLELVRRMRTIDIILTHGEEESTPLVNNLIARWKPHFNLATFLEALPTSMIYQTNEPYPRMLGAGQRRAAAGAIDETASAIYGPFPGGPVRDLILKILNEHFRLRTCSPLASSLCLLHEMGKCSGPCEGRITAGEYAHNVQSAVSILCSDANGLLDGLEDIADITASNGQAARADRIRADLRTIQKGFARLSRFSGPPYEIDAVYVSNGLAVITQARKGSIWGVEFFNAPLEAEPEKAVPFLLAHYSSSSFPDQIVLPGGLETGDSLSIHCKHPVNMTYAEGGFPAALLDIARMNHLYHFSHPAT